VVFKFHSIMQDIHPADRIGIPPLRGSWRNIVLPGHLSYRPFQAWAPVCAVGGGVRLKWGQPMLIDDVAVDFSRYENHPGAHPGWPWVDESLSMALHKENVFIDLSGWSPKYLQPQVIQYGQRPV